MNFPCKFRHHRSFSQPRFPYRVRNFRDLATCSIYFCILYAESPPYFYRFFSPAAAAWWSASFVAPFPFILRKMGQRNGIKNAGGRTADGENKEQDCRERTKEREIIWRSGTNSSKWHALCHNKDLIICFVNEFGRTVHCNCIGKPSLEVATTTLSTECPFALHFATQNVEQRPTSLTGREETAIRTATGSGFRSCPWVGLTMGWVWLGWVGSRIFSFWWVELGCVNYSKRIMLMHLKHG